MFRTQSQLLDFGYRHPMYGLLILVSSLCGEGILFIATSSQVVPS